jgi:hypothetical protein
LGEILQATGLPPLKVKVKASGRPPPGENHQLNLPVFSARLGCFNLLAMPNQLSKTKRRQSLAEHQAVLAALTEIARCEDTTVMALLRQATRELVKNRATEPILAERLRRLVWQKAPRMPARFTTAAQVARFKRAQREFDQVLLDLALDSHQAIQQRNSIASPRQPVRMLNFDFAHATSAV